MSPSFLVSPVWQVWRHPIVGRNFRRLLFVREDGERAVAVLSILTRSCAVWVRWEDTFGELVCPLSSTHVSDSVLPDDAAFRWAESLLELLGHLPVSEVIPQEVA